MPFGSVLTFASLFDIRIVDALALAVIVILGILVSRTDMHDGKIRNKHLLGFFIAAAILALLGDPIPQFLNASVALFVGFLLWEFRFWTAGDAKLMALAILAVPGDVFSSLHVFTMAFAVGCLWTLVWIVTHLKWTHIEDALEELTDAKKLGGIALSIFAYSWISHVIMLFLPRTDYVVGFLLLMGLIYGSQWAFGRYAVWVALAISVARVAIAPFTGEHLFLAAFYLLAYLVVRIFIIEIAEDMFRKCVKPKDLRAGMHPVDTMIPIPSSPDDKRAKSQDLIIGNAGLTQGQIRVLHKAIKEGRVKMPHLLIQETLPFAPFIITGAILALLLW